MRRLTRNTPVDPVGKCADPKAVIACNEAFGLRLMSEDDIRAAHRPAAERLDGIATVDVFIAVNRITGASTFQYREPSGAATGFLAMFPVRAGALAQLAQGAFNGVEVDLDLVARPGETPAAWYGWGFAALTRRAGAAVISAACAVQQRLYWGVPAYSRTATPDGVRVVGGKMGYRPAGGVDPAMVWISARRSPPAEHAL